MSLNEKGRRGQTSRRAGTPSSSCCGGRTETSTARGNRPVTRLTTAPNAERRRAYLATASDLLNKHLRELVAAWAPGTSGNYRADFVAKSADAALEDKITASAR
jgi:uncharacterized iron-regulated protein